MRTLDVMRNIDRSRFEFDFATLSGQPGSLDDEARTLGASIHPIALGLGFVPAFRRLLREGRFDVVHSHVHFTSGLILRLALAEGVPSRIAHFRSTSDGNDRGLRRRLQRALMKHWIDAAATAILGVNEGTLQEAWSERWQQDPRCRVLYNGLDLRLFRKALGDVEGAPARAAELRSTLGASGLSPVVIHVGSLESRWKNHPRLLLIFAALRQRLPEAKLWLVGRDGRAAGQAVRAQIKALGLGDSVSLLGERTDVPRLLATADLMLFPSLWEGLPGAVLEACAGGTPVLASDPPGVREIARHVPALQMLSLEDPDARWAAAAADLLAPAQGRVQARRAAARAFEATPFVVERAVDAFAAIYEEAARGRL
jgi:glycosyltransferase involved in cell wall biosynthesis